jgi:hypothetical protein
MGVTNHSIHGSKEETFYGIFFLPLRRTQTSEPIHDVSLWHKPSSVLRHGLPQVFSLRLSWCSPIASVALLVVLFSLSSGIFRLTDECCLLRLILFRVELTTNIPQSAQDRLRVKEGGTRTRESWSVG